MKVVNIRGNTNNSSRNAIVKRFNDPKDPLNDLIASNRTSAISLNLQAVRARVVFIKDSLNANTIFQAIGRVFRIEQYPFSGGSPIRVENSTAYAMAHKLEKSKVVTIRSVRVPALLLPEMSRRKTELARAIRRPREGYRCRISLYCRHAAEAQNCCPGQNARSSREMIMQATRNAG